MHPFGNMLDRRVCCCSGRLRQNDQRDRPAKSVRRRSSGANSRDALSRHRHQHPSYSCRFNFHCQLGKVSSMSESAPWNHPLFWPLSATQAYVLGSDDNLWLETGPWGMLPPPRQPAGRQQRAYPPLLLQALTTTSPSRRPWGAMRHASHGEQPPGRLCFLDDCR
jgi:hypothetical protein